MKFKGLFKEKVYESVVSVMPITIIVFLLSISITPLSAGALILFLFGALLLIVGMGFFTLGADLAMIPMGEGIGAQMSKAKRITISLMICFSLGLIITLAEPDLQILANQVPDIPNMVLILTVACGVGIFLLLAELRMLLKIPLSYTLVFFYTIIFILAVFTPNTFIPVSFDSGGVTTGPITVPFIMAMGIGMASVRSDKNSGNDSFGLIALCSIGPILSVLILGVFYEPDGTVYSPVSLAEIYTTKEAAKQFGMALPIYMKEVMAALIPIAIMFLLFLVIFKRFHHHQIYRIIIGFFYTYIGLVLFLTGVNVGFMPAGEYIGASLGGSTQRWLLVPIGALLGFFIVKAEPAVLVLTKQVEEVTNGTIAEKSIAHSLSIGVAVSVGISMLRILTGLSIMWFLIPGYFLSLIMTFFVPQIFTGIAFDSGGVASGPMTATFMLPLAMGACHAVNGSILTDAFGIVAMVAMTPLFTIQILGLTSYIKKYMEKKKEAKQVEIPLRDVEDGIVYFDE